ncbi:MAG: hypothetical protein H0W08_25745 [Acidobacteria bacterium]|nr:hypothetical protein [Acidobacteriota bacterium]
MLPEEPQDISGQVRQALKAGAVSALLVYVGTRIGTRFLSWPLLAVGGFLVVMTVYTLVVLWKPEWQAR